MKPALYDILDLVAAAGIILSCGHLSPPEIRILAAAARERRVRKVVIDHPFWLKIPFALQEELARAGAWLNYTFMEISPRWWTLSVGEMAEAIGKIGPGRVVISSDAGQLHNPPPVEASASSSRSCWRRGFPLRPFEGWCRPIPPTSCTDEKESFHWNR